MNRNSCEGLPDGRRCNEVADNLVPKESNCAGHGIDLPQRSTNPPANPVEPPDPIRLRIDGAGEVFWNDSPTPISALFNMMQGEVEKDPSNQPTLELEVSGDSDYGVLAKVLGEAKAAEMQKIGFVKQEM